MGFEFLTNTPLGIARTAWLSELDALGFASAAETVPVQDACGRITAEAVYAHGCAPHYAASAMDGIAVRAADTFGATDTTPVTLSPEQFTAVDTGDQIPDGCDAVIMVEEIVPRDDGSVQIHGAAAPWQYIRQIGEDVCAGEMILPAHTAVSPAAIGAMIAGGVLSVSVIRPPRIGIIPTGDEIVPPCADPAPGQILEFNGAIFSAMVREWKAEPRLFPIVPDRFDLIAGALRDAAEECDIVLLNAGSSAGREDWSAEAVRSLGQVFFHGIAMRPGKPAILGAVGRVPVLGVPGYPVSGILVIEELLKPLVDRWYHAAPAPVPTAKAVLTRPIVSGLKYEEFVRVRMGYVGDRLMASPLSRGAGVVTSFMRADGILRIPQGQEGCEAGQEVSVRLLSSEEKLKNTLVVIGSHDPLLDEVGNLLHTADPGLYMSSSHVGSMGGIMAVKRGEAHAAGCHLLDTKTGVYNVSYLRRYFPDGGVRLVRCVGRVQGLMLSAGNPLGIEAFADIARPGLRYVNRQKGSGTRILADYLCEKNSLAPEQIYGYDREELTHTSVAAQIAGGSADAGMGIYSAARLYGLDFLPICVEEYDLLIPDSAFDTPLVQRLLDILKSEAFRGRLTQMGGYTLENPGEIIPWMED
ncbi:MAG: molybdopterin biosynthesis protein [Lachnospiraceae bacterium]|nr:molybdopterin biosynthesis protein [Lachnospiraceae bacterium]